MSKVFQILIVISAVLFVVTGCQSVHDSQTGDRYLRGSYSTDNSDGMVGADYKYGEIIYVPVYPSIYNDTEVGKYDLTTTLSIHNIDLEKSIKITRVDYYNTNGDLIKAFIKDRLVLKPLQTVQVVIMQGDAGSGTGANVIVEWRSSSDVSSPIVEAAMIFTSGQQGGSFLSTGKVIKKLAP